MKVTLQITKKRKKGSIEIELQYAGKAPGSFIRVREPGSRIIVQIEPVEEVALLCYNLGVNYGEWTTVWVRLQAKEQADDSSQEPKAKE